MRRNAVNPDAVAGPTIQSIPDIRVIEWKRQGPVFLIELARIQPLIDEIDAKRGATIPGALLADTILTNRHIALIVVRGSVSSGLKAM